MCHCIPYALRDAMSAVYLSLTWTQFPDWPLGTLRYLPYGTLWQVGYPAGIIRHLSGIFRYQSGILAVSYCNSCILPSSYAFLW